MTKEQNDDAVRGRPEQAPVADPPARDVGGGEHGPEPSGSPDPAQRRERRQQEQQQQQ